MGDRMEFGLAVHRGDGKLEGGHSTPRRQVPDVGVRFSGLGTHEETVRSREEFRMPFGVRKSPRNEPAVCKAGVMGI